MAGTTRDATSTGMIGSEVDELVRTVNRLVTDVETLRAAFMGHTHRTPTTNPGATSTPNTDAGGAGSAGGTAVVLPASALTGYQIRENGTVFT